jgi:hypothetical protein
MEISASRRASQNGGYAAFLSISVSCWTAAKILVKNLVDLFMSRYFAPV